MQEKFITMISFILLLQRGDYLDEYIVGWEKFDDTCEGRFLESHEEYY